MDYSLNKFAAVLAAGFVSGCANTPVYEGRYPWEAGWREGAVEAVGEDDKLRHRYAQRCKLEAAQAARFARIRYTGIGKPKWQVVTVPKDSTLKVGDLVYVKLLDCAAPAMPRAAMKKSVSSHEADAGARHA